MYTIGEMAKKIGVPPSTLRYYDKEGLLPFVERSGGGMRMFRESDYEWLKLIECMKRTGMPLKDIRRFIRMAMQGDETISQRWQMCLHQRELVRKKLQELEEMLTVLDFKCWYYETASRAGTTGGLDCLDIEELPEEYRSAKRMLCGHPADGERKEK